MYVQHVRNVNEALPLGLNTLADIGWDRDSRNGKVRAAVVPVTTFYRKPRERVLFAQERDANPTFHFMEALWMLAGRNDTAFVGKYVKQMEAYSDDGKTLWGAYGKRWRDWFPSSTVPHQDQLSTVIAALKANPADRRQVISMWDGSKDPARAAAGGKDVPCNTQAFASLGPDGYLDLTVICRSNDMIWGAHGANAVHFSMLQEYLAAGVGTEVGALTQVSNNYHAYYGAVYDKVLPLKDAPPRDPYAQEEVEPYPMVSVDLATWDQDLHMFLADPYKVGLRDPFFKQVALPIEAAHRHYRTKVGAERYTGALEIIQQCQATDWRLACIEWYERRQAAFLGAADDGPSHAS